MSKFLIEGSTPLSGEVKVAGNKNSALPIIAATLLTSEECVLHDVPDILDVKVMLKLIEKLGKSVKIEQGNTIVISGNISEFKLDGELAGSLRASILLVSSVLAKLKSVEFPAPGGCVIGRRRLDTNLTVLEKLGAKTLISNDDFNLILSEDYETNIFLNEASVTGTANGLLLAAGLNRQTSFYNTASEPHIEELTSVLRKMGARIQGGGSNKIDVIGTEHLNGFEHTILPDYIEAGTFAIAAAATGGNLDIMNVLPDHLHSVLANLKALSVRYKVINNNILRISKSNLKSNSHKIQVGLHPNFPTDLMSPIIVLASQCEGQTLCHDWMYESRMFFVDKLIVMGANIIQCDPHRVIVSGKSKLRGQKLSSPDIRAGIALVIAAMAAEGISEIENIELVDRGYQNIEHRLNSIGARIKRLQ